MEFPLELEGFEGRTIVVNTHPWKASQVLVDGELHGEAAAHAHGRADEARALQRGRVSGIGCAHCVQPPVEIPCARQAGQLPSEGAGPVGDAARGTARHPDEAGQRGVDPLQTLDDCHHFAMFIQGDESARRPTGASAVLAPLVRLEQVVVLPSQQPGVPLRRRYIVRAGPPGRPPRQARSSPAWPPGRAG